MSEWAVYGTLAARQDIEQLVSAANTIVVDLLNENQPFVSVPFAVAMYHDGDIHVKGVFPPPGMDPNEAISVLWDSLAVAAPSLLAAVVVEEIGDRNSPYVRMAGEHREARAFNLIISWKRKKDDRVKFRTPVMIGAPGHQLFA